MSRPATARLKVNSPLGHLPALQYLLPAQLEVDPAYQRSLEAGSSQTLIRKIATFWNWDLCQPLVVARREDGRLFVIDGQHRLEAARLRGDIAQLPAVVVQYACASDEAASFVALNQHRRALTKLDLFKASVASGDGEAGAIVAALADAGLSVAPHGNFVSWKPGMVSNIGGIEMAWRRHGEAVTRTALRALAQAFLGQVLQYAGTLFPGIAAVCADEMRQDGRFADGRFVKFLTVLTVKGQTDWRGAVLRAKADYPLLKFDQASAKVMLDAWARATLPSGPGAAAAVKPATLALTGPAWCEQCDLRVTPAEAAGCKSRFCSLKVRA